MEDLELYQQVAIWGALLGGLIGVVAQRTNFCTMGAISDAVFMGDLGRLRAWALAIAVAIIGTTWMHNSGLIDVHQSIYLGTNFSWLTYIIGGLLFGFGMTLTGGCGNKTLVRLGAGNMKSVFVFFVMGVSAYATQRGLIGVARLKLEAIGTIDLSDTAAASQGITENLTAISGMEASSARWLVAGIFALVLLVFCFKDAEFRGNFVQIFSGIAIGGLLLGAWYITGHIGFDDFDPTALQGLSFIAPSGDTLQYVMTYTGSQINFGVALALGVMGGSLVAALISRTFSWEGFSSGAGEMQTYFIGAVMMGVGGIMGLGCTFGQGITGFSTLSYGSILALVSIIFGAVWGLKYQMEDSVLGGLKAVFRKE
ncbi:MAG: YeeE/YedE family protein [bacterium]